MAYADPRTTAHDDPRMRPRVRFDAIGEAWSFFKAESGAWVLAGLVVLTGNWALGMGLAAILGADVPKLGDGFRVALRPNGHWVEFLLSAALNGFFLGGMFRMACLQVRGRRIHTSDLFGVTESAHELIIGSLLYAAAVLVGGLMFVLPGFVAAGTLMFTVPLVVDGKLTGVDAVRTSWNALKGRWLSVAVFHAVLYVIAGMGICFFAIGLLFTMPLYALGVSVLYRDFFIGKDCEPAPGAKPAGIDPDF